MALTLAVFAAVQVVMPLWIRPHLLPADHTTAAIAATNANFSDFGGVSVLTASAVPGQPGAWILSSGPVDAAGQPVRTLPAACAQTATSPVATGGSTGPRTLCSPVWPGTGSGRRSATSPRAATGRSS